MENNTEENKSEANPDKKQKGTSRGGSDNQWKKECDDCGPQKIPSMFPQFNKGQFHFSIWFFVIGMILLMLVNTYVKEQIQQKIPFSEFKSRIENNSINIVQLKTDYYIGVKGTIGQDGKIIPDGPIYKTVPVDDPGFIELLDSKQINYSAIKEKNSYIVDLLLGWIVPFAFLMFVWRFMLKKIGGPGAGVMTFGKNNAQIVAEGNITITFNDVAGADEAKEELEEVVDFLQNPVKYTEIGGKIPKGVLLVGPPGTGKTLLARAVAGTAKVPFFRMSGSDFVEMFVGVGAARVRDLFKQAREKAPCIVFIDELDAIGKSRLSVAGGNDEREQTLNQLLVEMDGFDSTTGVILLSATNRPEVLDPALLRPGRFDRQIIVDKPDLIGREAILMLHSKDVKLDKKVDLNAIARATPGFAGADLANIINEAALLAVRGGRDKVIQSDLMEAIEKSVAGLRKKNKLLNEKERTIVAYHETGHAVIAALTEGSDPVQKITIIPRGIGALGYTLQMPTEDRFLFSRGDLLGKIDVLLGGRAAEKIIFDEVSTGAANDLTRATDIARKMITDYGMSEKFENVVLTSRGGTYMGEPAGASLSREYSEKTHQYVDEEIHNIIKTRYDYVLQLLSTKKELIEKIALRLLETETVDSAEFKDLMAGSTA
ncbi:MAG: ATP-dependent zinc metalloprotease FtsH [Spirochaetia bacterium]|nr:ATP-dependent zinc metalloprotease FtsH [Spirochaetia bacterium]